MTRELRLLRLRLVADDDGHWYCIPADKRAEFDLWLKTFGWGDPEYCYKGENFEQYRLNMHPSNHTFTDFQEDKCK